MLDERLSLAADLYVPCQLGADIGTDHGLLPCHLLKQGICQRMILADVSPKALSHAQQEVQRQQLQARAMLVCADGLDAITQPCGCISAMGMGGETLSGILRRGQARLQGATLVLSAHTELHLVRQALHDIGYHITREVLCRAAGRFYVFWQAVPGTPDDSPEAIRYGSLMLQDHTPLLREYLTWRIRVLTRKLDGLRSAAQPDEAAMLEVQADIDFYQTQLKEDSPC